MSSRARWLPTLRGLAARTLGATPLRAFVTIQLPLAARGIFASLMLAFARALGDFGVTLMVGGNIPRKTKTASLAIYDYVQSHQDAEATTMAILLTGLGLGRMYAAAKLAARFQGEGRSVILAAADTYRAGAVEQLRLWGDRLGVSVVAQRPGADPAAVAYDATAAGVARGIEVVIVDTAGRLQTSNDLMAELAKVRSVIARQLPGQPRHVLLVLDGTTGQNGLSQAEAFLTCLHEE